MSFHNWLQNLRSVLAPGRGQRRRPRRPATHRPRLEVLEDRTVPSGFQQINLVAYQPGLGHFTDPNLNGWGMTSMPNGSFCVANAFSNGTAALYTHSGNALNQNIIVPASTVETDPAVQPFVKLLGLNTSVGHPTGVIYNPTNDFKITENGKTAPATLIFDSIDGTISGWNPAVDPIHAILIRDTWADAVHNNGTPSVYTSLEIGQIGSGQNVKNVLYATDFLNNQLEIIGGDFKDINTIPCAGRGVSTILNSSVTTDPNSSVWSVSAVNGKLIVTFADLLGPLAGGKVGGGAVDVFNTDGGFLYQIDANDPTSNAAATATGRLENPWGVTLAPANFGIYSNDLLVGNVWGPGHINAYKPDSNGNYTIYAGQLSQPDGTAIAIKGLWDMEFDDGPHLFFDAGPNHPGDATGGLFGVIQAAGDQRGNGGGNPVGKAEAPAQLVQQAHTQPLPTTLTVTNTEDHGRGSLRAEIAAAQNGDTIVFSPSLDGKTIALTSGELDLTKKLTIQGPGAGQLTISGYGGHTFTRIFEVAPNTTVSLSGLSIINGSGYASVQDPGYAPWDGDGGGILNLGTLTLSACTIDYSYALNEGGGIYNDGTLTVSGCTVYGNRAPDGAGIANRGTATFVSSTISNNNASDTSPGSYLPDGVGGGISNGGTLTLSGCTVSFNYANGEGGGISNGGTLTVENSSTITLNYYPEDVYNWEVLYLDSTSTIGGLGGNPAIGI